MPVEKSNSRSYRFSNGSVKKLQRLSAIRPDMSDTAIIEAAIAHLLGTLEREQPVWLTSPGDLQKSHKRGSGGDAA